jgi:hypothetical protein
MLYKKHNKQGGAVLLIMMIILVLGASAMLLNALNSTSPRTARELETTKALAQAKEALIAYATTVDLPSTKRPGDLPCPDTNNDGAAESSCGSASGSNQAQRLGHLPWKTLGLPELRDGSGELLWYAVSNNFKNNTRTPLLNSDTTGTITVRASDGSLMNDGSSTSGAVAIIIAPGEVLQRTDKSTPQDRSLAGINSPENYLDIANGEDNADFIDSQINGFIQGKIKDTNGNLILNDQILTITQDNIMQAIQMRVAKEVINALNKFYCGDTNVNPAGGCLAAGGNRFYPRPADFSDASCLGNGNISGTCNSVGSITKGRIPANPAAAWSVSSILRGSPTNNWFQDNAWREVIFYAVANACTDGTTDCSGAGYLTLVNNPNNQKVIIIATGSAVTGQTRSTPTALSNYLEGENFIPLDDTYTQKSNAIPFNDITISIQ